MWDRTRKPWQDQMAQRKRWSSSLDRELGSSLNCCLSRVNKGRRPPRRCKKRRQSDWQEEVPQAKKGGGAKMKSEKAKSEPPALADVVANAPRSADDLGAKAPKGERAPYKRSPRKMSPLKTVKRTERCVKRARPEADPKGPGLEDAPTTIIR